MAIKPAPIPIATGTLGGLIGLVAGGCNEMMPVFAGSVAGFAIGCSISIYIFIKGDSVKVEIVKGDSVKNEIVKEEIVINPIAGFPKN